MPLSKSAEKCEGCGGDSYHYAGCTIGGHGELFLACDRWIERAYNALLMAHKSDSFVRLPIEKKECIEIAICMLQPHPPHDVQTCSNCGDCQFDSSVAKKVTQLLKGE